MTSAKRGLTINRAHNAHGDVVVPTGKVAVIPSGFRPRIESIKPAPKKNATTTALRHAGGRTSGKE
jgi:hypothetical protein